MRHALLLVIALASPRATAPIGTAHPIHVVEHAPDGSWLVVCQARSDTNHDGSTSVEYSLHGDRGDRFAAYVIHGGGPGTEIHAFANQSPDGHWVAVVRGGKLELHDASGRQRVVLPDADVEDDAGLDDKNRVTSFANDRMVYFRKVRGRDVVVVRELATGAERVVDVRGVMWRADVDPAGRWAKLRVLRVDTNRDGKIEWPDRGWVELHGCFQGDPHGLMNRRLGFDGKQRVDDEVTTVWLDLVTGKVVEDSTIAYAVGDALLRRKADSSLTLDGAPLVPAACNAKILGITATPPRVVVACGKPDPEALPHSAKGTLGVYGPKFAVSDPHVTAYDDPQFGPVRPTGKHLCPVFDDFCVDVTTGAVATLGTDVSVWHQTGDLAFVLEHKTEMSFVWNAAAGRRTAFPRMHDSYPDVTDMMVIIGGFDGERYDWVHDVHLGKATEWIHAIDTNGHVLVGPAQAQANTFPDGPLHWETR